MPDFEKIRSEVKKIIAEHGGKVEVSEWNANDGETMKVVMTFKQSSFERVKAKSWTASTMTDRDFQAEARAIFNGINGPEVIK